MVIREAVSRDIKSITSIYNQGIEDMIATLETEIKVHSYMNRRFAEHSGRYKIIVAELEGELLVGAH